MTNFNDDSDYPTYDSRRDNAGKSGGMSTVVILGLVFGGIFLVVVVCGGILAALLLPAVQQARSAARRATSKNKMKQIGLALHNYHDTHLVFPPGGTFDPEAGEYHHSWMTMLLPFVDQAPLYSRYDFDEPWNYGSNDVLSGTMIDIYLNSREATTMVGPYGAAHYAGNDKVFFKNSSFKIREMTDGTSNTILAGEVSQNFMAWGNPENVRDLGSGVNNGMNGLGSPFTGGAHVLLGDGGVTFLSDHIDPDVLKAMMTPADGEIIPLEY